ncbi:MAG: ATP synthase F0 subunit B [Terracidiphilus sp.]|jgi:F-type H+-transporting ATPase subunit b
MPHSQSSRRFFRILLLLTLAAGVAGAPSKLAAQAAANSGATAQTADQTSAQPEKMSQEEQETAFRLEGPVVKWTAKTFNLSLNITANIFEGLNFAVIVFGIGIPLFRFLPKFLRTRSEKVRSDIESARKATEEANARLSAIEAKLAGLDGEIAGIRAQVETESLGDEARIKSTIAEESARILAAAEQEMDSSAAQARRSLRHFAADLAISQAVEQLAITPQTDQALIAEFLSNVAPKGEPGNDAGNGAHKGGKK